MRKQKRTPTILTLAILSTFILVSCQTPQPAPTVLPEVAYTQAAQTIVAQLTLTAPIETATLPPTSTSVPTNTPEPTQSLDLIYTQAAETVIAQLTLNAPPPTATEISTEVVGDVGGGAGGEVVATESVVPAIDITPLAQTGATAEPILDYEPVFEDNFAGSPFWQRQDDPRFELSYDLGGYQFTMYFKNDFLWSVREKSYVNVIQEVDGSRVSGARNGMFGLVCRFQDNNNYYGLVVSTNGHYGIFKKVMGERSWLLESSSPTAAISPGFEVSRLRADCIGETLTLYSNNILLAQVTDDDLVTGGVGMVAGTRNEGELVALFDNYVIYVPSE